MTPRLSAWLRTAALGLVLAAPAAAEAQHRHSGAQGAPAAARSAPAPAPALAPAAAAPAAPRSAPAPATERAQSRAGTNEGDRPRAIDDGSSNAPGRRRGDLPKTGDAVARKSPAPPPQGGGGGGTVIVGAYPWIAYGGGYFGGVYAGDPWFGSYPPDPPPPVVSDEQGALRLKVKPREASVYVDGYYAGIVDDFDGVFQRLKLDPGAHHIDLRAPDYETLSFDVMIQPGQTTTYHGEMVKTDVRSEK